MTDRELLEFAAKAAGYEIEQWDCWGFAQTKDRERWNPLEDDGDALRLAVKIGWIPDRVEFAGLAMSQDPHAATRRAIVRAAAESEKEMK